MPHCGALVFAGVYRCPGCGRPVRVVLSFVRAMLFVSMVVTGLCAYVAHALGVGGETVYFGTLLAWVPVFIAWYGSPSAYFHQR